MYAVIRVRGGKGINKKLKKTLLLLRLHRVNHLVLAIEKQLGMLKKVQAYVTFGEIDPATLEKLLQERATLLGNKRLDSSFLKEKKFKNFASLAKALLEGKIKLTDLGIKPVFRLKPPKKGYEKGGIKKGYSIGGALGYRGTDINKLINKMI